MLIGAHSNLGQSLWYIHRKLVRRGILTGVVTFGAVVAEIGEVIEVGGGKVHAALQRGENGAITFAIPARVADGQDACPFARRITLQFNRQSEPPPFRPAVRTPYRS